MITDEEIRAFMDRKDATLEQKVLCGAAMRVTYTPKQEAKRDAYRARVEALISTSRGTP